MDKYINGNLIKRILVFKTRKHPEWKHRIADTKFLFWKKHIDYWYLLDPGLTLRKGCSNQLVRERPSTRME
jgi:hypothetical protein